MVVAVGQIATEQLKVRDGTTTKSGTCYFMESRALSDDDDDDDDIFRLSKFDRRAAARVAGSNVTKVLSLSFKGRSLTTPHLSPLEMQERAQQRTFGDRATLPFKSLTT